MCKSTMFNNTMFENTLFHVIRILYQEHTARWSEALPELTKPQYAVLEALDISGPMDQVTLAQASATKRGTLTDMLARMEKKGLIERHTDGHDARQKKVVITGQGQAILAVAREVAGQVTGQMTASLTTEETDELLNLLQKMLPPSPNLNQD